MSQMIGGGAFAAFQAESVLCRSQQERKNHLMTKIRFTYC